MATQDAAEIPFSSSHSRQAFKLIELPSELLELLESPDPPILRLQSGLPPDTSTASSFSTHALLVSPNKTYRIQQKSTSNPILVLQPSSTDKFERQDEPPDQESVIPRSSICAVATIEDTLELYVVENEQEKEKTKSVKVNKWHEKFAKDRLTPAKKGSG